MHYFLLIADKCPSHLADDEFLLMRDEEQDLDDIKIDELSFMTTLVINSIEPEPILKEFKEWWNDNVGGNVALELLTTDINTLNSERAAYVQSLEPGEWSIKNSYVAYPSVSHQAYESAREIVVASEFSIQ
jgi:hypothetical protein